jgi:hypothetical protein
MRYIILLPLFVVLLVLGPFGCKEEEGFIPPPPDTTLNYTEDIRPILEADCFSCHQPPYPDGDLDVTTYEALRRGGVGGDPVVEGDPDHSLFITEVDGSSQSHNPYFFYPTGDSSLAKLRRWIAQGALED